MALPVASVHPLDSPGARDTTPPTGFLVYVPGNPDFPTEFTDPSDPATFAILTATPGEGIPTSSQVSKGGTIFGTVNTSRPGQLQPQIQPARAGGGQAAVVGGFSDWYVDRIWIDPVPIDFGNIISTKQIIVSLLSTFRYVDRTLSSVDVSALGGGITVPIDPSPIVLRPQEDTFVTIEAATDGPPDFDADIIFAFDHRSIAIRSLGRRLILFWYEPEQPIEERLGWFTDIIKTRDGKEQRDSLRSTPRQTYQFRIRMDDPDEVASLRNLLIAFRPFIFGVPIWPEQQRVTNAVAFPATVIPVNTVDIDHRVDSTIMIWEPATRTFFEADIESFTDTAITIKQATSINISDKAVIVPLRFGYIVAEPSYSDAVVGMQETVVEFETTDNVDLAFADLAALQVEFNTHPINSLPILSDPNMMITRQQNRATSMKHANLDGNIGIRQLVSTVPLQDIFGQKAAKINNLADVRKWRSFLHWVRGSWGSFYLPTFRNDIPPKVDFQLDASSIIVANARLEDLIGVAEPHKSIMLELPDGTQFFAEIASVTAIDAATEQINLTSPFDAAMTNVVAATAKISWLELVRIEGDTASFVSNWAGGEGLVRFQTRTTQQ